MTDIIDITKLQALMREEDWDAAHHLIDEAIEMNLEGSQIPYWRAQVFVGQKRHQDALNHLRENIDQFNCKSLNFTKRALILDAIGRSKEALAEIECAPIEEEVERFHGLCLEARFIRLYLLAKNKMAAPRSELDKIPDDYRSIIHGAWIYKKELFV